MQITVAICTRNPHLVRLARVIDGLRAQNLDPSEWQLLLVDNDSHPPVSLHGWSAPFSVRILTASRPGLFHARLAAIDANRAPLLVFIDDDTVPAPDFLRVLVAAFAADPRLVAAGPRIVPDYCAPPPAWLPEFAWALALRDMGDVPLSWSLADETPMPNFTPIGAGLALRATALPPYRAHARSNERQILARSWIGQGSGGNEDKDLVYTLIRAGGRVAYIPDAVLHHQIPPERLTPSYFEKLLPGLAWLHQRTLHAHGLDNHPPISRLGCYLRSVRSWFHHRAWRRPVPRIRWLAACGIFRGLADNQGDTFRYPPPA